MARYFVTGATGFIGGRLVRQLVKAAHEVIALARAPSKATDLAALGVSLQAGDVTDKESMRAAMAEADGVFHVAGWYQLGMRDKRAARRINVDGTRNVLQLMGELGIRKGIYTSTLAVFGDTHGQVVDESYFRGGPWLSEYDRTKWLAHYEVAEPMVRDGLPLAIVQPGAVYGPGDASALGQLLGHYLRRRLRVAPKGSAYCWGHVEDTAWGHILAMERGHAGESYIIAGPAHTLREALGMAERITGVPAPRTYAPRAMLTGLSNVMGLVEKAVPLPAGYTAEYLRVAAGATYLGSSAKAQRELGFTARPLEEGLRETLEYEMQRLGVRP